MSARRFPPIWNKAFAEYEAAEARAALRAANVIIRSGYATQPGNTVRINQAKAHPGRGRMTSTAGWNVHIDVESINIDAVTIPRDRYDELLRLEPIGKRMFSGESWADTARKATARLEEVERERDAAIARAEKMEADLAKVQEGLRERGLVPAATVERCRTLLEHTRQRLAQAEADLVAVRANAAKHAEDAAELRRKYEIPKEYQFPRPTFYAANPLTAGQIYPARPVRPNPRPVSAMETIARRRGEKIDQLQQELAVSREKHRKATNHVRDNILRVESLNYRLSKAEGKLATTAQIEVKGRNGAPAEVTIRYGSDALNATATSLEHETPTDFGFNAPWSVRHTAPRPQLHEASNVRVVAP